jgi:hypothetical protein
MRMYMYTHTHVSDCVQTAYDLLLLPNNTGCETFLYKSGALSSFDWILSMDRRPDGDWANT